MNIMRGGEPFPVAVRGKPRGLGITGAAQIMADAVKGLRGLRKQSDCVTVFGSARSLPGSDFYEMARDLGSGLASEGFTVMSGGGPGVMEAVSIGAKEAGGQTIGCNIELTPKQAPNPYLDLLLTFRRFSTRKTFLVHHACALVALPGGFGTLDELFEAAVLIQKERIATFPLVLLGNEFWTPLAGALRHSLLENGLVGIGDFDMFHVVSTAREAVEIIRTAHSSEGSAIWHRQQERKRRSLTNPSWSRLAV